MPRLSRVTKEMQARAILQGIEKHVPAKKTRVGGKSLTAKELAAPFREHLDAMGELIVLRAQLDAALAREKKAGRAAHVVAQDLRLWVNSAYGDDRAVLADFGWKPPRKRGPKTVAGKAAGVVKARATRAARKTMGRRQRLKIRGNAPVIRVIR